MRKEAAQEWRIIMRYITIAENEGLSAIALTDHDTLDGIPDALDAAKNSSVELIPGVELSTNFNKFFRSVGSIRIC